MNKLVSLAIVAAVVFGASASYAAAKAAPAASGTVSTSNVGIGFGAVLMKGKSGKLFEILAVTTNGCCYSTLFAISSGTMGYKEGLVIGMNRVETYVAQNMDNLANDIAKGDGEYVNTLASLMEVKDVNAFKSSLKSNFANIYTSDSVTSKEVVANINRVSNS